MPNHDEYQTPLASRYASSEMTKIFSSRERATTWRKLWLWLAEAEKELGLTQITDKAIEAIRANLIMSDEAFLVVAAEERIRRHDVMSHVFALEKDAPDAAGIIHVGATSCYVTDNADLIFMRDALDLILPNWPRSSTTCPSSHSGTRISLLSASRITRQHSLFQWGVGQPSGFRA